MSVDSRNKGLNEYGNRRNREKIMSFFRKIQLQKLIIYGMLFYGILFTIFFLCRLNDKEVIYYVLLTNMISFCIFIKYFNKSYINLSLTRLISRITGNILAISVPIFMRKFIYNCYIKTFKVNAEEILDQRLENYKSVNEFFIRKIQVILK